MKGDQQNDYLVVGVTGPVGSGASTVSRSFESLGFERHSLSNAIKKELRSQKDIECQAEINESTVPNFRVKLQDIGNKKRKEKRSYWVDETLKEWNSKSDLVIDSIRNLSEVEELRERFGKHFFLIAVHASKSKRWIRLQEAYGKDQGKFDRDDLRDSDEDLPEGQQVSHCVQAADYVYVNENEGGSESSREKTISKHLQEQIPLCRNSMSYPSEKGSEGLRPAKPDEVHMATCYAQSFNSQCMKRLVGAVIVDHHNIPLSLGYNENPGEMKPCISLYKYCYKDEDMHNKLEKMKNVRCPECGEKQEKMDSPWKCCNTSCGINLKLRFFPSRNMGLCTAIHAEERAIRSLGNRSAENATIFATTFPCFQCSRYIVDAGIKRVVYVEAYPVTEALEFLEKNEIKVEPFQGFKARAFHLVFRQRS